MADVFIALYAATGIILGIALAGLWHDAPPSSRRYRPARVFAYCVLVGALWLPLVMAVGAAEVMGIRDDLFPRGW